MKTRDDIYNELKAISPFLAELDKQNTFSVPEGYFDTLTEEIEIAVFVDKFGNELNVSKPIPEGYFENLADNILTKIRGEKDETSAISPLVYKIGKENVFSVPNGYFEQLEPTVMASLPKKAKVVSLKPKNSVWKYAAAAVITGSIALTAYFWFFDKPSPGDTLATTENTKAIMAQANQIIKDNNFDAVLNSVSSDEIESYLTEKGTDVKTALVAASAVSDADNNLPAAEDYLFDETTLDKYLSKHNLEN